MKKWLKRRKTTKLLRDLGATETQIEIVLAYMDRNPRQNSVQS